MKKLEKAIKKFLLKINAFNQKQWFAVSLFTTTAGIWFSLVLNFWGNDLNLIYYENNQVKFTLLGIILTLVTISWSLISMMAQRYNEYHNSNLGIDIDLVSKTETIYETVENSITSINEKNVSEKIAYVDEIKKIGGNFPEIYVKPCVELNAIIVQMREVLSKLLTTKKHNIRTKTL